MSHLTTKFHSFGTRLRGKFFRKEAFLIFLEILFMLLMSFISSRFFGGDAPVTTPSPVNTFFGTEVDYVTTDQNQTIYHSNDLSSDVIFTHLETPFS